MHMIFIYPYFKKMYFVSLPYFYTNISDTLIYPLINNHATILSWKYKVIQYYCNIMTLMYIDAHRIYSIKFSTQSVGELNPNRD